jgi:hypothetical protein
MIIATRMRVPPICARPNACFGKLLKSLVFPAFLKLILLAAARRGLENSTELLASYHLLAQKVQSATRAKIPKNFFLAP